MRVGAIGSIGRLGLQGGRSGGFNPASLYYGTRVGFVGETTAQNLFTATGLVTPVAAFGDPIASVRDLSGQGRVIQSATLANRPLYGRAPASGVRNRADGAADVANRTIYPASVTANGVTAVLSNSGTDGNGQQFVEYTANGTGTALGLVSIFTSQGPNPSAASGQTWTVSAIISLVSGTVTAGGGGRVDVFGRDAGGGTVESAASSTVAIAMTTPTSFPRTFTNASVAQVRCSAGLRVIAGVVYTNAVFRFTALQLEQAASRSAYQANFSAFDITQAGVSDVTRAWFDATDVLTATVPNMGTAATVVYSTGSGVVTLTNQTIGAGSYNLPAGNGSSLYRIFAISEITAPELAQVQAWVNDRRASA